MRALRLRRVHQSVPALAKRFSTASKNLGNGRCRNFGKLDQTRRLIPFAQTDFGLGQRADASLGTVADVPLAGILSARGSEFPRCHQPLTEMHGHFRRVRHKGRMTTHPVSKKMPPTELKGLNRPGDGKCLGWLPFDPSAPLLSVWKGGILERFKNHALRQPDAICTVFGRETLTYAELDAASDRLVELIKERTGASEGVLSIYGDRNPGLAIALLGTMKAGFAFHIIDPKYPARRISDCVKFVRPVGILNVSADFDVTGRLAQFIQPECPWFQLDVAPPDERTPAGRQHNVSYPTLKADSPMYVSFT